MRSAVVVSPSARNCRLDIRSEDWASICFPVVAVVDISPGRGGRLYAATNTEPVLPGGAGGKNRRAEFSNSEVRKFGSILERRCKGLPSVSLAFV